MAAMEARFTRLESKWEQLLDLPRQMRGLAHKLDTLSPSQASPAPSAPLPHSSARVVPAAAADLIGRVDALTSHVAAQGRLMERLLDRLEPYMPEEMEAMRGAPSECDEDMSEPDAGSLRADRS